LQQLAILQNPGLRPLEGPLEFYVLATIVRPKTVKHALPWGGKTGDVDNYSKTAQDALNGICFHDDTQICDLVSRKRYGRPSLMIRITELEEPKVEPQGDIVQLTIAQMTEGK
jgi:Holliday junction resolvase RusA-like endonuclease